MEQNEKSGRNIKWTGGIGATAAAVHVFAGFPAHSQKFAENLRESNSC